MNLHNIKKIGLIHKYAVYALIRILYNTCYYIIIMQIIIRQKIKYDDYYV